MTIIGILVMILRVVAASFAIYNIWWAAAGARDLMRGRINPPEIYLSVVFWFSVAVLVFQASYAAGGQPGWRLLSYVILTVSMGLAAFGHRLGATMKARRFYATYNHLGVATAMVDLARVNPAEAERLADEARLLTATTMVVRGG